MIRKIEIKNYYNQIASKRLNWKRRNNYYHKLLEKYFSFIIPPQSKVLEIGCGTAELLNAVNPSYGVGIDFSDKMIEIAKSQFPELTFYVQDAEQIELDEKFDYIIISDLIGSLQDVQLAFENISKVSHKTTRIVISYYNYLWEPIFKLTEFFGLKEKQPIQNWLSSKDIENLLELENFETIKTFQKILFPKRIPLINYISNQIFANLPLYSDMCLTSIIVARPKTETNDDLSVSIVIPARNEKGNIENAIKRTPEFSKHREFIFIEGHSQDNTYEEMVRVKDTYPEIDIKICKQTGKGKGNAVREAFDIATGDVLMILDADLTMPPEDLPKFYKAIKENKGEFINGCRLVYQMEDQAMRFLNLLGNKFFGMFFSFVLGQRLKDTLCGTKVLLRTDYEKIKTNRHYFGDFDPFGDFDLLFGAAKLNLKIVELPIRYRDRQYGSTQIKRFTHGILLLKMSAFAARKIKFI